MEMRIKDIVGSNIKKYRTMNNETLVELAEAINAAQSSISDWETGKKMPRVGAIEKLASHWGINKTKLLIEASDDNIDNYDDRPSPVTSTYNYFDTGLSAGILTQVDPFTSNDVEQISLSDVIMGKYAGDPNIFISHINGESMNRVIPDKSLIAIKKYSDIKNLKNGDIVVFRDGGDMSVKRFYNNPKSKTISFTPDSTDKEYEPIIYRYEDAKELEVIGRVVVYTVEL